MLLTTDALLLIAGVFLGSGLTAGFAGTFPFDFMSRTPWTLATDCLLGTIGAVVVWSVVFHPAMLVLAGGFLGVGATTKVAGDDPVGFMDGTHPVRAGLMAGMAGLLTLLVWTML